jgi:hypothetical protein
MDTEAPSYSVGADTNWQVAITQEFKKKDTSSEERFFAVSD